MGKRLRNKLLTPPGGWRFEDPDTGFKFSGYASFRDLLTHVRNYRVQNRLTIPSTISSLVECWLCEQPKMARYCKEEGEVVATRTVEQYVSGAIAATKVISRGSKGGLSSQEEAERRASICVNCPHNKPNKEHSRLRRYSDNFVQWAIGSFRKTSLDDKLFSCDVCSCPLRAKVHVSMSIVKESLTEEEVAKLPVGLPGIDGSPIYCWQIENIREQDANS